MGVGTPVGAWAEIENATRSMSRARMRIPEPSDIASLVASADGQIRSFDLTANDLKPMRLQSWAHPCAGAGIGLVRYQESVPIGSLAVSDTVIGYQAMAGVDALLTDRTSARLGYWYFATGHRTHKVEA